MSRRFPWAQGPFNLSLTKSPARLTSADGEVIALAYLTSPGTRQRTPEALATARLLVASSELANRLADLCDAYCPPDGSPLDWAAMNDAYQEARGLLDQIGAAS